MTPVPIFFLWEIQYILVSVIADIVIYRSITDHHNGM